MTGLVLAVAAAVVFGTAAIPARRMWLRAADRRAAAETVRIENARLLSLRVSMLGQPGDCYLPPAWQAVDTVPMRLAVVVGIARGAERIGAAA